MTHRVGIVRPHPWAHPRCAVGGPAFCCPNSVRREFVEPAKRDKPLTTLIPQACSFLHHSEPFSIYPRNPFRFGARAGRGGTRAGHRVTSKGPAPPFQPALDSSPPHTPPPPPPPPASRAFLAVPFALPFLYRACRFPVYPPTSRDAEIDLDSDSAFHYRQA